MKTQGHRSSRVIEAKQFAVIASLAVVIAGCGSPPPPPPPPPPVPRIMDAPPPPKTEIPRYEYRGEKNPDPFIPLSATARSAALEEMITPNINSLFLKGIYTMGANKVALVSGGGYGYTIKGNRLYDSRDRMIPGYWCSIKTESAVVSAGGVTKEIKLRE